VPTGGLWLTGPGVARPRDEFQVVSVFGYRLHRIEVNVGVVHVDGQLVASVPDLRAGPPLRRRDAVEGVTLELGVAVVPSHDDRRVDPRGYLCDDVTVVCLDGDVAVERPIRRDVPIDITVSEYYFS
jgi:hypothetical protein